MLLSRLNEKAIEEKTKDAKISASNATIQMSFIAAICFLIAYGFTFSFSSYFNDRFFKLYNGIKDTVSSNYSQRFNIDGNDELSEISSIFNRMADKLSEKNQKTGYTLPIDSEKDLNINDVQELKEILIHIRAIEAQAVTFISKFENKK
jgi:signal transduction histidine kinase